MRKILTEIISLLRLNKGKTNLKVALLCLIAATLFWFFNSLNKDYTANVRYPISFIYDTDTYQEIDELPEDVLLNMTGVGWNLLRRYFGFQSEPLLIRLDIPAGTKSIAGNVLPTAITDQVSDLQLNYVLTDTLYINIDRKVTRYLNIAVDKSTLDLEDNYVFLDDIVVKPDSIRLTGPESLIEALGDTIFLAVSDSEIDSNFDDDIEVDFTAKDLILRNPPTANVVFSVEELAELNFEVPFTKEGFPEEYTFLDSTVNLSLWIRSSISSSVSMDSFDIRANFESFNAEDSTCLLEIVKFPLLSDSIALNTNRRKVILR